MFWSDKHAGAPANRVIDRNTLNNTESAVTIKSCFDLFGPVDGYRGRVVGCNWFGCLIYKESEWWTVLHEREGLQVLNALAAYRSRIYCLS